MFLDPVHTATSAASPSDDQVKSQSGLQKGGPFFASSSLSPVSPQDEDAIFDEIDIDGSGKTLCSVCGSVKFLNINGCFLILQLGRQAGLRTTSRACKKDRQRGVLGLGLPDQQQLPQLSEEVLHSKRAVELRAQMRAPRDGVSGRKREMRRRAEKGDGLATFASEMKVEKVRYSEMIFQAVGNHGPSEGESLVRAVGLPLALSFMYVDVAEFPAGFPQFARHSLRFG